MARLKFSCAFLLCFFITSTCIAQTKHDYDKYLEIAEVFFKDKEYLKAAENYSKAFFSNNNLGRLDHRYSAAQCWALGGEVDSAFFQLNKIAKFDYLSALETSADTSLITLRKDPRWIPLLALIRDQEYKNMLNKPVAAVLDTILFEDQRLRKKMDEMQKREGGLSSSELGAYWKLIQEQDAKNLLKVKNILDKYGWLSVADVGGRGNSALFLVIQHADLATQEQYLPMIRSAVTDGKVNASRLAMLEDRIAVGQGKNQIYGSQLQLNDRTGKYYVLPLEDPENVDKRRSSVKLMPMKEYVSLWGMIWSVEQYKKDLKDAEDTKPRSLKRPRLATPQKSLPRL